MEFKNKNQIGIVTEEGADLSQEIIEKYQIAVAPIKMSWPEVETLPGENTFQKMREAEKRGIKSFGKTSQPSLKDFLDKYQHQLERFSKVLCITLTSKLSGTYNSAIQAKNFLKPEDAKRVFVVDSLSVSAGEGLLILRALDLINQGKEIEEIVKDLEGFVPQIHFFAIIEDSKWLEASGRISSTLANWMRKAAKIGVRPLIGIKKGIVAPVGIKIGVKDIPTALFREFEAETRKSRKAGKKIRVVITHGDDIEGAQKLKQMIEKEFKDTEVVFLNLIDNVLGVLVGPDALLLAWCEE